jgi:hypothetical protein
MSKSTLSKEVNQNQQQYANFQLVGAPKGKFQKRFANLESIKNPESKILPKFQQRLFAIDQYEL